MTTPAFQASSPDERSDIRDDLIQFQVPHVAVLMRSDLPDDGQITPGNCGAVQCI
jgi:hypothetical protein